MVQAVAVGSRGRLERKLGDIVRPQGFLARALLYECFDAVPDLSAAVLADCVLHGPLVVIDKKPAHGAIFYAVNPFEDLQRSAESICRTASELPLVIQCRAKSA